MEALLGRNSSSMNAPLGLNVQQGEPTGPQFDSATPPAGASASARPRSSSVRPANHAAASAADTDGNGFVDYAEFVRLLGSGSPAASAAHQVRELWLPAKRDHLSL